MLSTKQGIEQSLRAALRMLLACTGCGYSLCHKLDKIRTFMTHCCQVPLASGGKMSNLQQIRGRHRCRPPTVQHAPVKRARNHPGVSGKHGGYKRSSGGSKTASLTIGAAASSAQAVVPLLAHAPLRAAARSWSACIASRCSALHRDHLHAGAARRVPAQQLLVGGEEAVTPAIIA